MKDHRPFFPLFSPNLGAFPSPKDWVIRVFLGRTFGDLDIGKLQSTKDSFLMKTVDAKNWINRQSPDYALDELF